MADMHRIQSQLQGLGLHGDQAQYHGDKAQYTSDICGNRSIDSGIHVNSAFNSLDKKPGNGRYPHHTAEYSSDTTRKYSPTTLSARPEGSRSQENKYDRGVMFHKSKSNQDLQRDVTEDTYVTRNPSNPKVKVTEGRLQLTPPRVLVSQLSSESPHSSDNSSSTCTETDLKNPYEDHIYSEIGSLSRTPLSFHSRTRRRLSWSGDAEGERETKKSSGASSAQDNYINFLERYPKLRDVEYIPWSEQEVLNILREGRTKRYSGHITVEMMQRLSLLLHKPLIRIARETQRLASTFRRCTRHDLQSAMKVILSRPLYDSCLQACARAVTLYSMGGGGSLLKESKSHHSGLRFSVGRFHRWMMDARLSPRVHETAAIFLAACMENLLEEIVLRALSKEELGDSVLSLEALETGVARSAELWGLLQPYQHLVCGRSASGALSLPTPLQTPTSSPSSDASPQTSSGEDTSPGTLSSSSGFSSAGSALSLSSLSFGSSPDCSMEGRGLGWMGMPETLSSSLLATCVGSVPELSSLVSHTMLYWHRGGGTTPTTPTSNHRPLITWGADALHVLFHYMRCSKMAPAPHSKLHGELCLSQDRPYTLQPPLLEWVRVTLAHTEHRCALVVDGDDVMQAARVLLPATECPPRQFSPSAQCWRSTQQTSTQCCSHIQRDMAFSMLCTGRSDLLPRAISLLGPEGVDTCNDQGLTPLMCACLHGDEAMVQMLLDAGASVNKPVPSDSHKYPALHPDLRHWTPLTFATLLGHISIMQLLLERGAHVEGRASEGEDPVCETPLQVAAAAGHYDLVTILLTKGADPYLTSVPKVSLSCGGQNRGHNAFTLAAMHGHRHVFKKLLTQPQNRGEEILSLEEMLAESQETESTTSQQETPSVSGNQYSSHTDNHHLYCNQYYPHGDSKHVHGNGHYANNKDESEEDAYMTIDEVMVQSINKRNEEPSEGHRVKHSREHSTVSVTSCAPAHNFSKTQFRIFQEAMYHAAETAHLDIALELRSVGVTWSLHTWSQCLWAAHSMQRKAIVQCLLKDFLATSSHDDLNTEFVYECLPLMCHIFRNSKNEITGQQLANILSSLYGNQPIPPIPPLRGQAIARIDPVYVNNPEMSDIQFLIEGRTFHGHKILLVNASSHMRTLLEEARRKTSSQEGATVTQVQIHDVKFRTFEMMMTYLYNGAIEHSHIETKDILELLKASHTYKLAALKRHCEILCSRRLHLENCVAIYKHAKVYQATELLGFCEGFFLQNLTHLLNASDGFRKLLYSYKMLNYDLVNGLLATLSQTLEDRLNNKTKGSTLV